MFMQALWYVSHNVCQLSLFADVKCMDVSCRSFFFFFFASYYDVALSGVYVWEKVTSTLLN